MIQTMDRQFLCQYCHKTYLTSSNYCRHLKTVHGVNNLRIQPKEYDFDKYVFKCLEGCNTSYATTNRLIDHLILEHSKDIPCKKIEFVNYEDFSKWKAELEMENAVQYIQHNGKKIKTDSEILHFKCNRSCKPGGNAKMSDENQQSEDVDYRCRKRKGKSSGSSKINCSCTSQIIVNVDKMTRKCKVCYIELHYGHELDARYVKIPKLERLQIANKLKQGVSISRLLEDIHSSPHGIPRATLITRKDIHNIKKAFNIGAQDESRHSDDLMSVSLWVDESLAQVDSPVLLYKLPGEANQSYSSDQDLIFDFSYDDFCLILMSNAQVVLLRQFGSNVICTDSCHGSDKFEYELTTLVVLDEFGQGLPVASMWSNRIDTEILEIFFLVIRGYAGEIRTTLFVSDMNSCYYDAWDSAMNEVPERYYTPWSVDIAWDQNMKSTIKSSLKRKQLLNILRNLQSMLERELFISSIDEFVKMLFNDSTMKEFQEYFLKVFVNHPESWAFCFREDYTINLCLLSLHRVIMFEYQEGKKIYRLDKAIMAIYKLVDDKLLERVNKITGDDMSQALTVTSIHNKAYLSKLSVEYISNREWKVLSKSGKVFYVEKLANGKCCDLACIDCKICYHSFKCSCPDYLVKGTICKHIHKIIIYLEAGGYSFLDLDVNEFIDNCLIKEEVLETVNSKKNIKLDEKNFLSIRVNHNKAYTSKFSISPISKLEWKITNKFGTIYYVKNCEVAKCCELSCEYCKICYHSFECSCPDYENMTICSHIHKILIDIDTDDWRDRATETNQNEYKNGCLSPRKKKTNPKTEDLQFALISEVDILSLLVHKETCPNVLRTAFKTLRTITALLKFKTSKRNHKGQLKNGQLNLKKSLTNEVSKLSNFALKISDAKLLKMALQTAKSVTKLLKVNRMTVKLKSLTKE